MQYSNLWTFTNIREKTATSFIRIGDGDGKFLCKSEKNSVLMAYYPSSCLFGCDSIDARSPPSFLII